MRRNKSWRQTRDRKSVPVRNMRAHLYRLTFIEEKINPSIFARDVCCDCWPYLYVHMLSLSLVLRAGMSPDLQQQVAMKLNEQWLKQVSHELYMRVDGP